MGVCICLAVSKNIKNEEWEKAYEESLKLVNAFPFYEVQERSYYGKKLNCAVPTKERKLYDKTGWCTRGDYNTLRGAEDYFLPRELEGEEKEDETLDALMGVVPAYCSITWKDERCSHYRALWEEKTQGEPYHMYLLAVACLLEARLGRKVAVYGDITKGQCQKAVEMANRYLEKPIEPPARCDTNRFYERVRALPLKPSEVLEVFINCFLGKKDGQFGMFIREHFTPEEIEFYWRKKFAGVNFKTSKFNGNVHKYLTLGFSLEALCSYIKYSDEIEEENYSYFVRLIMQSEMHIKEKDCRDFLKSDQEREQPYSIYTLMARFAFSGAENKKVDRFIPLAEIREILKKCIGELCDVDAIIQQYCEEQEKKTSGKSSSAENPSDILNGFIDAQMEEIQKADETFDITEFENMIYYKKGNSFQPEVEKDVLEFYRFYAGATKEDRFKELMEEVPRNRCRFLMEWNQSILLREEDWKHLFDKIETEKDSFRRYYPMVRVKANSQDTIDAIRAVVLNDELFQYCERKITENA